MPTSRTLSIASWSARIVTAGILTMGAIPKFTGGAAALAAALPGGSATVLGIGAAETVAVVLLLIPRLARFGAALAAVLMLGAVASHLFGPVGMDGELGGMFPLAVLALLSAGTSLAVELKRHGCCLCSGRNGTRESATSAT